MSTWQQALDAINTPDTALHDSNRPLGWRPFWKKFPITVTGLPGAGKTELFSRLTGRNPSGGESSRADVAYARTTARRTAWAMRTIPGALSTNRYRLTDRLFYGRQTRLYGLIYVVSFGYNTVWRDEYTVESQIGGNTLQDLRRFQIQKELEDLDLLAELIATKTRRTPDQQLWPRWLVVAVNKADLYWDDIDTAAQYYLPGSGSPFDRKREKIVSHFGGLYPFVSETIPVALSTTDFTFTAREMDVTAESQLHPDQISAAVNFMRMRLEGLSGI